MTINIKMGSKQFHSICFWLYAWTTLEEELLLILEVNMVYLSSSQWGISVQLTFQSSIHFMSSDVSRLSFVWGNPYQVLLQYVLWSVNLVLCGSYTIRDKTMELPISCEWDLLSSCNIHTCIAEIRSVKRWATVLFSHSWGIFKHDDTYGAFKWNTLITQLMSSYCTLNRKYIFDLKHGVWIPCHNVL